MSLNILFCPEHFQSLLILKSKFLVHILSTCYNSETEQNPLRPSWLQKPFHVRCFLFVGKRLPAPFTFPEFQRADSTLLIRGVRESRNKGKAVRKQLCRLGAGFWFLLRGWCIAICSEFFHRSWSLHYVEEGNISLSTSMWTLEWLESKGWWLGFLEHNPATPPSINQGKVTHPAALPTDFAYKNSPQKLSGSLSFWAPATCSPCLGLAIKPFSAPNSRVSVYLASSCISHINSGSTTMSFLEIHCKVNTFQYFQAVFLSSQR